MSSEISRMERCTGRFFRRVKILIPNSRRRLQFKMPQRRSLGPATPRKETEERSGRGRLASPPPSAGAAHNAVAETSRTVRAAERRFGVPPILAQPFTNEKCMENPPKSYESILRG